MEGQIFFVNKNRKHVLCLRERQKAARVGTCGLLPQHTEMVTVLQTATPSVHNVKFHYHKIKLQFRLGMR